MIQTKNIVILGISLVVLGDYIPLSVYVGPLLLTPERASIILLCFIMVGYMVNLDTISISLEAFLIIFLICILLFSVAWSIAPFVSARRVTDLVFYLIFYIFLTIYLKEYSDITNVLWALSFIGILVALYGWLGLGMGGLSRHVLAGASRNDFARTAVGLLPILVVSAMVTSGHRRSLFTISAVSLVFLIPSSGSRSGLVAMLFVCSLLVLAYINYQNRYTQPQIGVIVASLLICLTIMGVIGFKLQIWPERLTQIPLTPSGFSAEVLGRSRINVWKAELVAIRRYWLTGMGYGAFKFWSEAYGIGSFRAHDPISRVWLSAGIGSVVLLLSIFLLIVKKYTRIVVSQTGLTQYYIAGALFGLLGMVLAGMANIVITESLLYVYLAIGANSIKEST